MAKIVEVHPGIYEIFLPLPMRPTIINVYLIDCHGAWTLVDTGMNSPESIKALEDALAELEIKSRISTRSSRRIIISITSARQARFAAAVMRRRTSITSKPSAPAG